ncbi:Spy/CpxP family protein refolding chaperone [Martelella sp. HB161492]|uniref:Spy/CpxP family protein refolding chaperone n=1 Tax=Martelella sp. HB161492 TaxID=2720726 RepID=UPI001590E083|nr:Spy/CpxP family protein refolding chaperone [Martelella sp. HB161492]
MKKKRRAALAFAGILAASLPLLAAEARAQDMQPSRLCRSLKNPAAGFDPARLRLLFGAFLASEERAIGITTAQKDAWNAFSDAVIALIPTDTQISEFRDMAHEGMSQAGWNGLQVASAVAARLQARGAEGDALAAATANLKAVLTPDQLAAARVPSGRLMQRLSAVCND